mmetsp:Transcript_12144/g.17808  ORF Transcript_12144/g.17808 Transcript_12144/m.17808 type:complete len:88 (-) Transcript_12144:39-302(-)
MQQIGVITFVINHYLVQLQLNNTVKKKHFRECFGLVFALTAAGDNALCANSFCSSHHVAKVGAFTFLCCLVFSRIEIGSHSRKKDFH